MKLQDIYTILKGSLRKTICTKKQMGKTAFTRGYGDNIAIRILRRDGQKVTLDFKKPPFFRAPNRFYCSSRNPDPLQKKN
jgi:hypothetical protein